MDREFRKWMKWYGKKHAEYTVSEIQLKNFVIHADVQNLQSPLQPVASQAAAWLLSYLLPGFCLDPEDGVLWGILPGSSLCVAWHVIWCYWEHFQVFSEALGRFILLKRCRFNWSCHVSFVCIKSPLFFSPLSLSFHGAGVLLGRLLKMAAPPWVSETSC